MQNFPCPAPPRPAPARKLRSLAVLLGGLLTRIFDPPPPENVIVTGLCNNAFFKSHHDFCSYQIRRPTHNRWPRSERLVGWGGGGGGTKGHHCFSLLTKVKSCGVPPPPPPHISKWICAPALRVLEALGVFKLMLSRAVSEPYF